MTATRFVVVLFLFITCDSGFAQDSITNFDESEVKAAVEEIGVLDVCPDQASLNLLIWKSKIAETDFRSSLLFAGTLSIQ